MLATLNPEQRAAAEHGDAPLVVVAGAGTGKTTTLAARLAMLVQRGADPQRVLLLSFSRRAAQEMARRAGRLLHEALGLGAGVPPPVLPWCGTFHSVAARLLRDDAASLGLDPGFTVLDRGDAQDLLALTRQRLGLAHDETEAGAAPARRRFPLAATCLAIHSRCVNARAPLAEVLREHYPWCAEHEAALVRLFAAWGEAKRAQHSLDFDDLLLAWWHLMQDPGLATHIAARYDHVLVDEVQDLNRLQHEILLALRPGGRGLTAVGDDAQAIYGFRGADLAGLFALPGRFAPPARVLALERNYRSTAGILAAADAVIAQAGQRFAKTLRAERGGGARPRLVDVADEAAQARAVADAVLAEREQGVALRRQAVLFRTASHSAALELELLRRGIPFVKYGGLRFFESAHVKDLLAVLRWADNPRSQLAALRCARLVPGLGPASLRRLLEHPGPLEAFRPPRAAAQAWPALLALLQRLREAPRWPAELDEVIAWLAPQLQRQHDDAATRLADLRRLAAMAAGHASRERFVTELTLDPPAASSDEAGPPQRDEDWLVLSTIHSAKGQEWSAVHVLNVVDGCLPADMATGRAEEIDEERRLLYVAMTRAKDALTLWVPQRLHVTQQRAWGDRHLYTLRSRFLPDELLPLFEQVAPGAAGAADAAREPLPAFDLAARLRAAWTPD
ncbi:MAG: ATP-dependent helicase [Rubrivivax sp.]|nr:ATP-dependent helicase [Rubrivivax sp.]